MHKKLLLNMGISPDGVIGDAGGGSPKPPAQATPATEETPKQEEETLVTIDEFDSLVTPAVKAEDKPKTEDKVEDKTVETSDNKPAAEQKPEVKPAVKPVATNVDKTQGRDYSGIAEEHVAAFKKMSNEAFAAMKPIYLERQQAAAKLKEQEETISKLKTNALPDSYYENDKGFVLDPAYQQAASNLQVANMALTHWKQQLRNIEEGKDWVDLDVDDKGNLVYSKPKAADAEARVNVLEYFQHALGQVNHFNAKVAGVKTTFVERNKQQATEFSAKETQWFPAFADGKHPLQPAIDKVQASFPAAYRNNPLARALAKALVVLSVQSNEKKEAKPADKPKRDVTPTETQISGGEGGGKTTQEDVTIDDFNKLIS